MPKRRLHYARDTTPGSILRRLFALLEGLLEMHQKGREVWGIGLAVAAPVEAGTEPPFVSPLIHTLPGWGDYPLVEYMADKYAAGVWVRSKVQMMALGELRAGMGVSSAT